MAPDDDDRRDDVPPVTAGSVVLLQLREAAYEAPGPDGTMHTAWLPAAPVLTTVHAAIMCGQEPDPNIPDDEFPAQPHLYTVCTECISSWACDYYVTLPDTPQTLGLQAPPTQ